MSAEQHLHNSNKDRQPSEQFEQIAQVSQESLSKIATNGLQIWQSYLTLGTTMAQAWADNLQKVKSSLDQMAANAQEQVQQKGERRPN